MFTSFQKLKKKKKFCFLYPIWRQSKTFTDMKSSLFLSSYSLIKLPNRSLLSKCYISQKQTTKKNKWNSKRRIMHVYLSLKNKFNFILWFIRIKMEFLFTISTLLQGSNPRRKKNSKTVSFIFSHFLSSSISLHKNQIPSMTYIFFFNLTMEKYFFFF